jgi:hypothetical protein
MGTRGKCEGETSMKHHAKQLFPIALDRLLAIGEKGMKQRDRERAKHVARPRETRACKHAARKEKQAKQLQLQLK